MKKGVKISCIAAGILLAVGILLCGITFAASGFDFSAMGTSPDYEKKIYETDGSGITAFTLQVPNRGIRVRPSEDEKIRIIYYEEEKEHYAIQENNGTLDIRYSNARRWYEYFFFVNFQDTSVTIELPAQYKGALKLKGSNAAVRINGITFSDEVRINTSNGKIELSDIQAAAGLYGETSNASIRLNGIQAADIEMQSSNGDITAERITAERGAIFHTSNDEIVLRNVAAPEQVRCITSNDEIEFFGVVSDHIYLKTSNDDITGEVNGSFDDYRIISATSNGDIQVHFDDQ